MEFQDVLAFLFLNVYEHYIPAVLRAVQVVLLVVPVHPLLIELSQGDYVNIEARNIGGIG
jgi:hypothetical protein